MNHLQAKFIRWPDTGERAAIAQSFATKNTFPSIIGAIDGSHILIIAPNEYAENFINGKSFHSIVLQVVCDEKMIFRDIVVGWPGCEYFIPKRHRNSSAHNGLSSSLVVNQ